MAGLTPMMQQYKKTKEEYSDCILFYRLGDFYEMFFEDAITCSRELEIALTGKSCGLDERAPMCGIPFHAVDAYLDKLVERGYKVAICEQVEDPKQAKGLVKREVTRIVTPGTILNTQSLDEGSNNYLMSVVHTSNAYGIAYVDVTTGDFFVTELDSDSKLLDEIGKVMPSEIVCNDSFLVCGIDITNLRERLGITVTAIDVWHFDPDVCEKALQEHFGVMQLSGLGLADYGIGLTAAGAVLTYLQETQKTDLTHLKTITPYVANCFMLLDRSSRRNLELTKTMRDKEKRGSLLWVLDKTKTAMGARMLRSAIEQPLIQKEEIERRLDAVAAFHDNVINREEIREYLQPIYDLERLISKISYKSANPRDLLAFGTSLSMLPAIHYILESYEAPLLREYYEQFDTLEDLHSLIAASIAEDAPLLVHEGNLIKDGYHKEVDRLREAKSQGKNWLAKLAEEEKEKTGIKNLRIKYNKVFGYYLEVTNSYKELVPKEWVRKQTLAGAERYTTERLKELEDTILGAEDKLDSLEYHLFCEVRDAIYEQIGRVQKMAKVIAGIDMYASLAVVAEQNQYVRPAINEEGRISIKEGRHPVVEQMIQNELFVSNDTNLDNKEHRISIITGPNMAGKSTYMRQTALIVLMAQIGSFVPAASADIGIVDRIFTRVGASDDLASGQSTFMVEMTEVSNILRNATKNSLIILDEIGRGTSTFDGLSIAWAVVEHIANPRIIGAKTLFATHYHELTELEGRLEGVYNYCIAVKEQGDSIIFLRKIVQGGADKSYGIQVAKLAGVPEPVLVRARELADELAKHDIAGAAKEILEQVEPPEDVFVYGIENQTSGRKKKRKKAGETAGDEPSVEKDQLSMFDARTGIIKTDDIIMELRNLDLTQTTPIDAMNVLYQMQKKIKERM